MAGVVGVTGHRPAALAGVDLDLLERRVDTVLDVLAELGHDHLLSGLAEGTDRLVARRALASGWTLHAVLPFERLRYEADFDGSGSRAEFAALLDRSARVSVARAGAESRAGAGPAADLGDAAPYAAQGRTLVAGSDMLVAVWDGLPARGPGGTADVVGWARAAGAPVVWIHLRPPHRLAVLDAERGEATSTADLRRRLSAALEREGG
ncbi:hypothetical protein [Gaopeijia maritima]|uniref:Uncharacterized protein n=1 Tax=Gaopeijia maritima TaxID=3119007 RepID=A0ABU9E9K8_9BACT